MGGVEICWTRTACKQDAKHHATATILHAPTWRDNTAKHPAMVRFQGCVWGGEFSLKSHRNLVFCGVVPPSQCVQNRRRSVVSCVLFARCPGPANYSKHPAMVTISSATFCALLAPPLSHTSPPQPARQPAGHPAGHPAKPASQPAS